MNPQKFNPNDIRIGMHVWHPIWGKGTVYEYTNAKGVEVSFEKSVFKHFNCRESQIYGEDHYAHLFIEPIKIETLK